MNTKEFIKSQWYDHAPSATWYDMIRRYAKGRKLGLDIGTSGGFSACAMALEGVFVISIDKDLKQIAKDVAKELKLEDKIVFSDITSDSYFEDSNPYTNFDIIIVDGNHDYDYVYRDLDNSWNHLNEGGVIIADDYERYNGTRRAINDWVSKNKPECNVDLGRMVIWKK